MSWVRGSVLVLAAFVAGTAHAQGFFELSPGPLTNAHAELDDADNCTKCHELGKGVTNFLCLDCHEHQPLREAIKKGHGLHAGFKQLCRTCHTEHKGREALAIDWGPIGGRQNFDHKKTGFELTGKHQTAACTACHKKKLKSGRSSYVGLEQSCDGCHKNPHAFANNELRAQCTKCHQPGIARNLKPAELPFDHGARTGVALEGKHATTACTKCHQNAKMTLTEGKGRTCGNCHKNPHGRTFRSWACTDCHAVTQPFRESSFDHDRTKFPLRGDHAKASCSRCHKSKDDKPSTTCSSCHGDPHRERFLNVGCERCHEKGGTVSLKFDHASLAKFALTGAHKNLTCRSCHRGSGPKQFEKFPSADCKSCHAHTKAHNGQFNDKNCLDCHSEGGSKQLVFDHQKDTRFALTGLHQELDCKKCHARGQYRTNKLACSDCHQDSHRGQLGADCARCHATNTHFKGMSFDHDKVAQFPLTGEHEKVECNKCHPDRRYDLPSSTCNSCHADDEPHAKKLGTECERCHQPVKGAPLFDHETMTKFARTGSHQKAACTYCHREKPKAPPELGWTKTLAPEKLDRTFPTMGMKCAECHRDRHEGRFGLECQSCHDTLAFNRASRAIHDTGAFRLMGVHDTLACARCHQTDRLLSGTGELCQSCHREDDAHNNALGPYCGECHSQQEWMPPRFNHAKVGFVLRGAHKSARCDDCHGAGTYAGTPAACDFCHTVDASKVADPIHNVSLSECSRCHTEVAFAPARRSHPAFPLDGAHAAARCSSCHPGGMYEGTGSDCLACHQQDYMASTRPSHAAAGFSTECAQCHVTSTFQGARYQHQTFVARGAHRTSTCDRCHTGGIYTAAFGGAVAAFECVSCHGPGAPVDKWPPDHVERGYPYTCELCHNELGWKPAREPR
jgi:hypothetical protein